MKKRIIALLTCLTLIISVICIMPDSDAGVATLNITKQKKTISAGQSFQIKLDGIKSSSVKWSSSKASVAKVNKKGIVTGVKAGKAVITGKYKQVKFTIDVTVTKSYPKSFSNGNISLSFIGAKFVNAYGEKYWSMNFKFFNEGSDPVYFGEKYSCTAYVNGVETHTTTSDKAYTSIKDGASAEVNLYYKVKSGDKFEFDIRDTDKYKTLFKQTYIIP